MRSMTAWFAPLVASTAIAHTWVPGPPAPVGLWGRARSAMVFDGARGRVVLFGGTDGHTFGNDTWLYDGASWQRGPNAPAALRPRASHGMAYDETRSRTVVFGGIDAASAMNDTWELDGAGWTQGPAAPAGLSPRRVCGLAYDSARSRCVIFGGTTTSGTKLDDTWEYDGVGWMQGPIAPAGLGARASHSLSFDPVRARVVLFGGSGPNGIANDTWEYDGTGWTAGPAAPTGLEIRYGAGMVFDAARGRTVLFGGVYTDTWTTILYDDTWEYDGTAWSQGPPPAASLTPRCRHAMAYDPVRMKTVLFGGIGSPTGDDAFEYDGTAWQTAPSGPPSLTARTYTAAAFDTWRARVVLFGGAGGFFSGLTWEYDGASWSPAPSSTPGPSPRLSHAMAFDSARGVIVLTGGSDYYVDFADTWEYDGSVWTAGPSIGVARSSHAMTFDSARSRMVLFGGWVGAWPTSDTIEYDGTAWSPGVAPPAAMNARSNHAMAFDPIRKRTVVFGGSTNAAPYDYNDTWEYDGTAWYAGPAAPPELLPRRGPAMVWDDALSRIVLVGGDDGWPTWEYDGNWSPGGPAPSTLVCRNSAGVAYDSVRDRIVTFGGRIGSIETPYNDTWEYAPGTPNYVVGAGLGDPNPDRVRVLDTGGAPSPVDFMAYGAGRWGVNVATGDLDLDSYDEIVTGPGPGPVYGPAVKGFRKDGTPVPKINYYAYATLKYGVNPSSASIDVDAYDEILSGAGPGAVFGPHVRGWNFDASAIAPIPGLSYYAYGTLKYGVNDERGDVDGDTWHEILTAPGPGPVFAPLVRGWNFDGVALTPIGKINFWAFAPLAYGANVSGAQADGDSFDEILAAPGPGPGPSFPGEFRGFDYDGVGISQPPGFDIVAFSTSYGGRLGADAMSGGSREELLAAAGRDPAADSTVRPFIYTGTRLFPNPAFVAVPGTVYGVNPTGGMLGI
ncbi:MAG: kelch repeat-containing protein [Acidobacteriota bacterium]